MEGKFKFFSRRKGYGFICGEDGKDLFVHITNLDLAGQNFIGEGQPVTYDIGTSEKDGRPIAVNAKVIVA